MKLTKKYFLSFVLLAFAAPALTGCSDIDRYSLEEVAPVPSEKFNAKIQYVTRLNDATLFSSEADYTAVENYMVNTLKKNEGAWLTILDRADQNAVSKVAKLSNASKHWSAFAFNQFNSGKAEGSYMLFNTPTRLVKGMGCGKGAFVMGTDPLMNGTRKDEAPEQQEVKVANSVEVPVSFKINYNTVRFTSEEQIAAFGGAEGVMAGMKKGGMNMLVIGTVKNSLEENLIQTVTAVDPTFIVTKVAAGSEYSIFMLCQKTFWGFTKVETTALSNGINSYEINVMW